MIDKYLKSNATIGSSIVEGAQQLGEHLTALVLDEERCSMLNKLIWSALQDLYAKMPEGVNPIELLMVADIIAGWGLRSIAKANACSEDVLQKSWALSLALRYELLPKPEMVRTNRDKPS